MQFICLLQNIPVNAQFKLLQFELRANLSDIYIRDECVRGTVEIAWKITSLTHADRHLFVDLPTYLCQQLKCWESNGSASSQTCQLRAMCSLVNQHLMNSTKKAASLRTYRHTNAHKLRIYTPAQRRANYTSGSITSPPLNWAVAEFHHHLRHSEPREIFLQRKFPFDNWSVYWNLHMPTWWFCAAACCDGNDNTDYGLETANLMRCDCLNAFTLKISLFHATVKLCERTVLVLYAVKQRGSAVI